MWLKEEFEDKQKVESVYQANLLNKSDLSKKTIDELLDEIREQQIKLIKRGLCPKCKVITQPEGSTSSKRPRNQPLKPPSPPWRPIHNRFVCPGKEPLEAVKIENLKRDVENVQSAQPREGSNQRRAQWEPRMVVPPVVEPGYWHRIKYPKFSYQRSGQPTKN